MAPDRTEDLAELRDELDVAVQRYEAAATAVPPTTGRDTTGTVEVTVDPAGALAGVVLATGWRRQVGPHGLAGALGAAMTAAAADRAGAWAEVLAGPGAAPPSRARPMPSPGASLAGSLDAFVSAGGTGADRGSTAPLEALLEMVRAINDGIDQVSASLLTHLTAEFPGETPSGSVRATVTGSGEVRSVVLDDRWLADAHDAEVGRDVADALHRATAAAQTHGVGPTIAASPLGEVADLAADPRALAARLGLGA